MDSNIHDEKSPDKTTGKRDPVKDAEYARSLLQNLNVKLEMEQANLPKKPLASPKKIIYIVITTVIIIVSLLLTPSLIKNNTTPSTDPSSGQLPNSGNPIKDQRN